MPLNRRTFLQNSLYASAGLLAGCQTRPELAEVGLAMPCAPDAWCKHGIVLEATEVWEGNHVQNFTTRTESIGNDAWRIWYSVSDEKKGYAIAYAEGIPGESMKKVRAECSPREAADAPFSLGNLPQGWKPVQPTHIQMPNGRHRLYFWAHGPQVCRYLAAESEDGHRYRVINPLRPVLYHPNDRAAFGVPSPDGIMYRKVRNQNRPADEPLALSRLISNDATTIYQLPNGTFELFSVALVRVPKGDPAYIAEDNAPGLIRVVDRYTSADGLDFETRQRVIQRDSQDPSDQQFYYLSVTSTPKGRVGMLGHYRCAAQTTDLEWCFSSDGVNWQRPLRQAWLPRDQPPGADCFGIYPGSQLLYRDSLWHLFYTGVNSSHNGRHSHGKPRQVILHATAKSIWA
jgi:hypothetical protein